MGSTRLKNIPVAAQAIKKAGHKTIINMERICGLRDVSLLGSKSCPPFCWFCACCVFMQSDFNRLQGLSSFCSIEHDWPLFWIKPVSGQAPIRGF